MVAAALNATFKPKVTSTTKCDPHNNHNRRRPPLLPSDADNGVASDRRPRSREVSSRYSSSNSAISRPNLASTVVVVPSTPAHPSSSSAVKRSQSVERRRSVVTRFPISSRAEEMSVAAKVLVSSTRSYSVSFQGESFPLPIIKAKAMNCSNSTRKCTPERPGTAGEMSTAAKLLVSSSSRRSLSASFQGDSSSLRVSKAKDVLKGKGSPEGKKATPVRNQNEHLKPVYQQRWPGSRSKQSNALVTRVRSLQQPMTDKLDGEFLSMKLDESRKVIEDVNVVGGYSTSSGPATSDVESVSSGSSDAPRRGGGPRGIIVPARFWQETTNRFKQIPEPVKTTFDENPSINTPISTSNGVHSSRGGFSSPIRSAIRPSSPNKLGVSPSKAPPSPKPPNPSLIKNGNLIFTPSILNFPADVRRGKPGDNKIDDLHMLRLLHNQHLQWRFVNARAETSLLGLEASAKKSLYNGWVSTAKLQHSVESQKLELQMLRQNLKLYYIIKEQLLFSDDWNAICSDHSIFLSEATKALEATTIRLPLVSGATKVDIQDIKDAISSSTDVMQAMTSKISSFISKAQETNSSISELASIAAKEYDLINECKDLLSTLTALQVSECSMRTHILQLKRENHLP